MALVEAASTATTLTGRSERTGPTGSRTYACAARARTAKAANASILFFMVSPCVCTYRSPRHDNIAKTRRTCNRGCRGKRGRGNRGGAAGWGTGGTAAALSAAFEFHGGRHGTVFSGPARRSIVPPSFSGAGRRAYRERRVCVGQGSQSAYYISNPLHIWESRRTAIVSGFQRNPLMTPVRRRPPHP